MGRAPSRLRRCAQSRCAPRPLPASMRPPWHCAACCGRFRRTAQQLPGSRRRQKLQGSRHAGVCGGRQLVEASSIISSASGMLGVCFYAALCSFCRFHSFFSVCAACARLCDPSPAGFMAWFRSSSARDKERLSFKFTRYAGHFHHAGIQEILGGPVKKVLFVKETFLRAQAPFISLGLCRGFKPASFKIKPYPPK